MVAKERIGPATSCDLNVRKNERLNNFELIIKILISNLKIAFCYEINYNHYDDELQTSQNILQESIQ